MVQDAIQLTPSSATIKPRLWRATMTHTLHRHQGQPHILLYLYVIGMAVVAVFILFLLFAHIPYILEGGGPDIQRTPQYFKQIQTLFVMTIGMMLCCGALGGCLFDIRGLIQHSADGDFNPYHNASYLLRPFAGAISGFIVFLVLVGGLFALDIQPPRGPSGELDWIILRRQLPFMAFATLAGYSSHVFMGKLKAISDVIFSMPETAKSETDQASASTTHTPRGETPPHLNGHSPQGS